MGLLMEATNEQAYLKAGFFGTAGSGKTTTASYLAMAISKKLGDGKPVAFFETEAGSDFLVERFKEEGIKLLRKKSHALADLIAVAKEAEGQCSVLIIDSISHVWAELCEAKLQAVNKFRKSRNWDPIDKLSFEHWADVKREWGRWTTFFLNSNLHIIVCGRAGNVWEYETNEKGKKELIKGESKMKAEGEFGYEPSLLIEMARESKGNEPGQGWKHRAFVLKDRTDTINGMVFDFERAKKGYKKGDFAITFKPFEPVIKALNIGGIQNTVDEKASSERLFPEEGGSNYQHIAKQKEIALEEISASLDLMFSSRSDDGKNSRTVVVEAIFGTRSKAAMEKKPLEELRVGIRALAALEEALKETPVSGMDELRDAAAMALFNSATPETDTLEKDSLPI